MQRGRRTDFSFRLELRFSALFRLTIEELAFLFIAEMEEGLGRWSTGLGEPGAADEAYVERIVKELYRRAEPSEELLAHQAGTVWGKVKTMTWADLDVGLTRHPTIALTMPYQRGGLNHDGYYILMYGAGQILEILLGLSEPSGRVVAEVYLVEHAGDLPETPKELRQWLGESTGLPEQQPRD